MYAPLYDDDHRAVSVSATGSRGVQTIQKGLRERLLCSACEGRLGEWERVVAPAWKTLLRKAEGATPRTKVTAACAYAPLKLFTLSLFFRACVAVHPNFAAIAFDVGTLTYVRTALLTGVPGTVADFPSCLIAPAGLAWAVKTIGLGGAGMFRGVPLVRIDVSGLTWFFALGTDVTFPIDVPLAVTHHGLTAVVSDQHEAAYMETIATAALRGGD